MIANDTQHLIYSIAESNDRNAFGELVTFYFPGLVSFATTIVKDKQLAEEVVEDVFVKLWENRRTLTSVKNFSHYIYTATKYSSLNAAKGKKNFIIEEMGDEYPLVCISPESLLINKQNFHEITNAINALPPKCRLIFRLIKEDGMKYEEVAQLLGLSVKTIENQMNIALKRISETLRKIIPEYFSQKEKKKYL